MILAALALAASSVAARVDEIAAKSGLAGEILIARGRRILLDKGYGPVAPGGTDRHRAGQRWRLASITKQVTAAMVVRRFAANPRAGPVAVALDDIYPGPALMTMNLGALTTRQLLTHHSGLANTDDTPPGPGGVPRAYSATTPDIGHCLSQPAKPGAPFAYNNCDYIVLGEVLRWAAEAPAGTVPPPILWPKGMTMAQAGDRGVPGFVGGKPEPAFELAAWGAAGGLIGTAKAVFDFDRALMTDKDLANGGRDALWKPEGNGSYQALGQWVFPGQLKGCAAPKRIVQRDGEIYGVQARNFILPDDDLVVIVFTNRSSDDFAIGEVWQGKGFAYDLLSAAACP